MAGFLVQLRVFLSLFVISLPLRLSVKYLIKWQSFCFSVKRSASQNEGSYYNDYFFSRKTEQGRRETVPVKTL